LPIHFYPVKSSLMDSREIYTVCLDRLLLIPLSLNRIVSEKSDPINKENEISPVNNSIVYKFDFYGMPFE